MTCAVCRRDEKRVNNDHAECSVVDCPHRRQLTACPPSNARSQTQAEGCYRITPPNPNDRN